MQNEFLKMVLAVGLMSLSSIAIAEGKYTAKFPLKGVEANPTFGMPASEKEEYLSNIEMCLNEGVFETGEYEEKIINDVEITLKAGVPVYDYNLKTYIEYNNCWGTSNWRKKYYAYVEGTRINVSLFTRGDYQTSYNCGNTNTYYTLIPNEDYTYIGTKIEKEPVLEETENYNWCVNNNYETAN